MSGIICAVLTGFLTVLVLVSMVEQQRQEQPIEHQAIVATAGCPRP